MEKSLYLILHTLQNATPTSSHVANSANQGYYSYYNHPDFMILKQRGSTIGLAVRYKNLFVLETSLENKTMLV